MKQEYIVANKLHKNLVKDIEWIECVEQTDWSTTMSKLLSSAAHKWHLDYYESQYAKR